jgi:hypothetical protein
LGGMQYYAEEIAQLIQPKPKRLYAVG